METSGFIHTGSPRTDYMMSYFYDYKTGTAIL